MNDFSKTVEKIKNNIALIVELSPDGRVVSKGSGFVFHTSKLLATCYHVVQGEDNKILIRFPDLKDYVPAEVVIKDIEHDLALLKFDVENRTPLKSVPAEEIKEGMPVIFSGYPLTLENLATHQGILSAIIQDATGITTYMIDGTVNSGNSGCPLMNVQGGVIGVVNAKRRENNDILSKVEGLSAGAVSIHSIDLVHIMNALISNVNLGIGYAVPCSYIPTHHEPDINSKPTKKAVKK